MQQRFSTCNATLLRCKLQQFVASTYGFHNESIFWFTSIQIFTKPTFLSNSCSEIFYFQKNQEWGNFFKSELWITRLMNATTSSWYAKPWRVNLRWSCFIYIITGHSSIAVKPGRSQYAKCVWWTRVNTPVFQITKLKWGGTARLRSKSLVR